MTDTQVEEHFWLSEAECTCKGRFCEGFPEDLDPILAVLNRLQKLRDVLSAVHGTTVKLILKSGYRCSD